MEVDGLLDRLRKAQSETREALKSVIGESEAVVGSEQGDGDAEAVLGELRVMVESFDPGASELVDSNLGMLRAKFGPRADDLAESSRGFDFARAKELVEGMLNDLD
jgi:hypothetical protein